MSHEKVDREKGGGREREGECVCVCVKECKSDRERQRVNERGRERGGGYRCHLSPPYKQTDLLKHMPSPICMDESVVDAVIHDSGA